eukprot:TRINITY_DN5938_c0_g1_i1.p1 TRINITY_DN5938_c0_g1~~TRINITY_DN5938_c0_g1_i1.p1  ORF type:complete len:551 (+),score=129.78 TRINITY_DN5938_c0_g1_i1:457-2109(+)
MAVNGALAAGYGQVVFTLAGVAAVPPLLSRWADPAQVFASYGLGFAAVAWLNRLGAGLVYQASRDCEAATEAGGPATLLTAAARVVNGAAGVYLDVSACCVEMVCAITILLAPADTIGRGSYPVLVLIAGLAANLAAALLAPALRWTATNSSRPPTPSLSAEVLGTFLQMATAWWALPYEFTAPSLLGKSLEVQWWHFGVSVVAGLWGGHLVGAYTRAITAPGHDPVRDVAEACDGGAAAGVRASLAVGQESLVWPAAVVAAVLCGTHYLCGVPGAALAALGPLTLHSELLVGAVYDAVVAAAGDLAAVIYFKERSHALAQGLRAAGAGSAASSEGYTLTASSLVTVALLMAFVGRGLKGADPSGLLDYATWLGLLAGLALPHWLWAAMLRAAAHTSHATSKELQRQLRAADFGGGGLADWERCPRVAITAALHQLGGPTLFVLILPVATGLIFGTMPVAGLLLGLLVSGVSLGVPAALAGGSAAAARRFIEAGGLGAKRAMGSKEHHAILVAVSVGAPLRAVCCPTVMGAMRVATFLCLAVGVEVTAKR